MVGDFLLLEFIWYPLMAPSSIAPVQSFSSMDFLLSSSSLLLTLPPSFLLFSSLRSLIHLPC